MGDMLIYRKSLLGNKLEPTVNNSLIFLILSAQFGIASYGWVIPAPPPFPVKLPLFLPHPNVITLMTPLAERDLRFALRKSCPRLINLPVTINSYPEQNMTHNVNGYLLQKTWWSNGIHFGLETAC